MSDNTLPDGVRRLGAKRIQQGNITSLQFLDSRRIAVASFDGVLSTTHPDPLEQAKNHVAVWDIYSGEKLNQTPLWGAQSLARAEDGSLFIGGRQGVHYWDPDSSEPAISYDFSDVVLSLDISPDQRSLIIGTDDGGVYLLDIPTNQVRHAPYQHPAYLNAVAFISDSMIASGSQKDPDVRLWNINTDEVSRLGQQKPSSAPKPPVGITAIACKGQTIATANRDGTLRLWSRDRLTLRLEFKAHKDQISSIAFSPDGRSIITGARDRTIKTWSLPDGHMRFCVEASNHVWAVDYGPQGTEFASGGTAEQVRIWDGQSGHERCSEGHTEGVRYVSVTEDDARVLSIGTKTLLLWNLKTSAIEHRFEERYCHQYAISNDTLQLARPINGNGVVIMTPSGDELLNIPTEKFPSSLKFSPDGNILMIRSSDQETWLHDTTDGKRLATIDVKPGPVMDIGFIRDAIVVLCAYGFVWLEGGKERKRLDFEAEYPYLHTLWISPDATYFAVRDASNELRMYNAEGELLWKKGQVVNAVWSSDGARLAVSHGPRLAVVNPATGARQNLEPLHQVRINDLAWTSDGRLLSAGDDANLLVWNLG